MQGAAGGLSYDDIMDNFYGKGAPEDQREYHREFYCREGRNREDCGPSCPFYKEERLAYAERQAYIDEIRELEEFAFGNFDEPVTEEQQAALHDVAQSLVDDGAPADEVMRLINSYPRRKQVFDSAPFTLKEPEVDMESKIQYLMATKGITRQKAEFLANFLS